MTKSDLYSDAHLAVAAIRILEHQHSRPPSIEEVCECLAFSLEKGNQVCRKLDDLEVVRLIDGAFGTRISIRDHLKLEEIPRDAEEDRLSDELKKFQESRKQITQKVATIQAEQAEKRKSLFAELEKKLKKETDPPD